MLIATPVAQTPKILEAILPHLAAHTVITDAGSTKSDIAEYVEAAFNCGAVAVACVGAAKSPKAHKNVAIIEIFTRIEAPTSSESDFLTIIYGAIGGYFLLNDQLKPPDW